MSDEYDLDMLERGFLIDRVRERYLRSRDTRVTFCFYAPRDRFAAPMAITVTGGAWLLSVRVDGCDQMRTVRYRGPIDDESYDPRAIRLPEDLLIGPAQLDPALNGRRGYPIYCAVLDAFHHVAIEVWRPADEAEIAVTVYGPTISATGLSPASGASSPRW